MNELRQTKILSRIAPEHFFGRTIEAEAIRHHATGGATSRGLLVLSAPKAGASELLLQTYDRIFRENENLIPFYFAFSRSDKTAKACAARFLQTFLTQTLAFRRGDTKLLDVAPDVCEMEELAAPSDARWIHQLITACRKQGVLSDERAFVRQALSAPLRAAANDAPVFVMIDDLHNAENLAGETDFIEELKEIYARADVQFVLAGRRRFAYGAMLSGSAKLNNAEILRLEANADAEILVEGLAESFGVATNAQTRDLINRQFGANVFFIESIFAAARAQAADLQSFQAVERAYVEEFFGGRIGKFYDEQFDEAVPQRDTQRRIVELLSGAFAAENETVSADVWRENLQLNDHEFYKIIGALHTREIINFNSNQIKVSTETETLRDYAAARRRLEISDEPRAAVVGDALKTALKRAPQLMTRAYRRSAAIGLRKLLTVFNCQIVPGSLLDYARFKKDYKGLEAAEISEKLNGETEKIVLPQIVYATNCAAFYPPIAHVADDERCAVALGFDTADCREENEIVWIAAEIDSKLEAPKELAEFWCDRLEMVALTCNFPKYQLWLIAPEGFAPGALEVLQRRKAFGSSRRQTEFLIKRLKAEKIVGEKTKANEYEMVVPMGDDTEMIAAGAVEEIARRHNFQPKAITQIKTALVEACINASEHSLSPDRKIYQKFTVEDGKIIIVISNRGIKISPKKIAASARAVEPENGRRGWGLKLMRTLMDEVKFEQTDDGTRISMVKYLKR